MPRVRPALIVLVAGVIAAAWVALIVVLDGKPRWLALGLGAGVLLAVWRSTRIAVWLDEPPASVLAPTPVIALVAEAAGAAGAPMPGAVRVTLEPSARVAGDVLWIGLPLLAALEPEDLTATVRLALRLGHDEVHQRSARLSQRLGLATSTLGGTPVGEAIRSIVVALQEIADALRSRRLATSLRAVDARPDLPDVLGALDDRFRAFWSDAVAPQLIAGRRPPVLETWLQRSGRSCPQEWAALERAVLATRPGGEALVPAAWAPVGDDERRRSSSERPAVGPATTTVRLATSARATRAARRRTRVWGAATVLSLLLVIGLAATTPELTTGRRALLGVGCLALVVRFAFYTRRPATREHRGALAIGPDAVTLEHDLLRKPWRVRRELLQAVAFDDTDRSGVGGDAARLLVHRGVWSDPGSSVAGGVVPLWTTYEALLPMVGVRGDRPTLALVFSEPVAGPVARRRRNRSPLLGNPIAGLLLVAQPDARVALADHGLLADLGPDDLAIVLEGR